MDKQVSGETEKKNMNSATGARLREWLEIDKPERNTQATQSAPAISIASGFASALRLCGVINLIASLIGGYIIWSNAPSSYFTFSGSSGYYFGLAMAVVLQGIFFFIFFNVVAEIAETLKAILHKLSSER